MVSAPTPGTAVGRIAFVGPDGQIYTVDPDGSHPRRISPETGAFTWPTWSPDGTELIFSGVAEDERGGPRMSLLAFSIADGTLRELYVAEPGAAGLLAEGVVHYPLWSPDGTHVAFLAFTSRGLTLLVDDLTDSDGPAPILDQGPLWMAWSPDSQYLLVHRGADHFLVNTRKGMSVERLGYTAMGYRVPDWRPPHATITLASEEGIDRYTILSGDVVDDGLVDTRSITSLREIGYPLNPAFLWAPGGDFLALSGSTRIVSYLDHLLFVYRDLAIMSENEAADLLVQDNVMAYFWSPDGSRLAYVAPSHVEGMLRWAAVNVRNGKRWHLMDFIPSPDQLTVFEFFDQYASSHSPWSPDSRSLVFAGKVEGGAVSVSISSGSSRQGSHIIVVGTDPDSIPQTIAEGILAFWSPR